MVPWLGRTVYSYCTRRTSLTVGRSYRLFLPYQTYGVDVAVETHLVDVVLLCEVVEDGVHGVEHGDYLHGCDATADLREGHHVGEQDGDALERLPGQGRSEVTPGS